MFRLIGESLERCEESPRRAGQHAGGQSRDGPLTGMTALARSDQPRTAPSTATPIAIMPTPTHCPRFIRSPKRIAAPSTAKVATSDPRTAATATDRWDAYE